MSTASEGPPTQSSTPGLNSAAEPIHVLVCVVGRKKGVRVVAVQGGSLVRRVSSPSTDNLELARQRVVTAFAAHWRRILRSRKDIARERADFFFAGSASARERLARNFYGREHAQQMASLSTTEIRETLSPWLEHALRYWLDEYDHIGDPKGDDFLAELPTAEYVSIVCPHHTGSMLIDRYPGERVFYDDLYERMLSGFSSGGVLRIYKATGERFTPSEARSVRTGIRRDLLQGIASAGDEDPWVFNIQAQVCWQSAGFEGEDLDRVVMAEVNDYGDRLLGQEEKGS